MSDMSGKQRRLSTLLDLARDRSWSTSAASTAAIDRSVGSGRADAALIGRAATAGADLPRGSLGAWIVLLERGTSRRRPARPRHLARRQTVAAMMPARISAGERVNACVRHSRLSSTVDRHPLPRRQLLAEELHRGAPREIAAVLRQCVEDERDQRHAAQRIGLARGRFVRRHGRRRAAHQRRTPVSVDRPARPRAPRPRPGAGR